MQRGVTVCDGVRWWCDGGVTYVTCGAFWHTVIRYIRYIRYITFWLATANVDELPSYMVGLSRSGVAVR